jgi:hypothetical protein
MSTARLTAHTRWVSSAPPLYPRADVLRMAGSHGGTTAASTPNGRWHCSAGGQAPHVVTSADREPASEIPNDRGRCETHGVTLGKILLETARAQTSPRCRVPHPPMLRCGGPGPPHLRALPARRSLYSFRTPTRDIGPSQPRCEGRSAWFRVANPPGFTTRRRRATSRVRGRRQPTGTTGMPPANRNSDQRLATTQDHATELRRKPGHGLGVTACGRSFRRRHR